MSLSALTYFSFLSQPPVTMTRINTTQKRFCFHWLTHQDGHLSNCLKQGNMVHTENPYYLTHTMGLHSEEDMTFSFTSTLRPKATILTATLAILTAHPAGTATEASSHINSWQEHLCSHQTKKKLFTKQPKYNAVSFTRHFSRVLFLYCA